MWSTEEQSQAVFAHLDSARNLQEARVDACPAWASASLTPEELWTLGEGEMTEFLIAVRGTHCWC